MKTTLLVSLLALPALGQSAPLKAPVIKQGHRLDCPSGTRQVGGARTALEALTCVKGTLDGLRVFHGPFISFYRSGAVEAQGQVEDGFRAGKWTFYDEKGTRVGETEFQRGDFHGRRVFYYPTGQVKSEERYSQGRQVGAPRTFDEQGNEIAALR